MKELDRLTLLVREIKTAIDRIKGNYLIIGKNLTEIKDRKLWKKDGSPAKSFHNWVMAELRISKATAYHAIDVHKEFGHLIEGNKDFYDLDFWKLIPLLPYAHLMNDSEKSDFLHTCAQCTTNDIKDAVRSKYGGKVTTECEHGKTEVWERCVECGKFLKQ